MFHKTCFQWRKNQILKMLMIEASLVSCQSKMINVGGLLDGVIVKKETFESYMLETIKMEEGAEVCPVTSGLAQPSNKVEYKDPEAWLYAACPQLHAMASNDNVSVDDDGAPIVGLKRNIGGKLYSTGGERGYIQSISHILYPTILIHKYLNV